jgi:hypothetical protein
MNQFFIIIGKIRKCISSFNTFWKRQKKATGTILITPGLKIAVENNLMLG